MAKRQTTNKPPVTRSASLSVAALLPAVFDGLRDAYLASITWPADTPDAAKAMVVEHVNGFIGHLAANAEAAGLIAKVEMGPVPEIEEPPEKGMIEVMVTGPREGRRRIGRAFTDVASTLFVTPAELDGLKADPKLMVRPTGTVAS